MPMAFTDQGFDKWRDSLLEVLPDSPASNWCGVTEEMCCVNTQPQTMTAVPALPPPICQYNDISSATGVLPYPVPHVLGLTVDTDSLDSFSDDPDFLHPPAPAPEIHMPPCVSCEGEFGLPSLEQEQKYVVGSTVVSRVCQTGEDSGSVSSSQSRDPESDQGEKASRKTNPHLLPPCKVCGAQATGYHYGVNSCEACKGFFHRSLLRKKPYKCYRNIKCEIKPGKRNVCGHCRYQKCLQVGMSKDGIKTGRYTYEKRTHDILEIKQSHLIKAEIRTKQFEESHQLDLEHFISQLTAAKEKLLSDVELVTRDDHVITAFHKGDPEHLVYIPCEEETEVDLIERSDQDLGGKIWKKWASVVQHTGGVNRLVKFVKVIPGFRDLEMSDQIQLIKHAFCEIWVILRHQYFDVDRKLYTYKVGFSFDIVRAFGESESTTLLRLARRLQNLNLTDQEVALMMAFVTFFSDRCSLTNPQKVDSIQETILKALQYELHKHHSSQKSRFGKIMDVFIELRSITELYQNLSEKALSTIGEMAPLLWEIINLS